MLYFVYNTIYNFWFQSKSFWFTHSTNYSTPNSVTEAKYYSPLAGVSPEWCMEGAEDNVKVMVYLL